MAVRKLVTEKMANGGSFSKLEFAPQDYEKIHIDDYRAFFAVQIDVKMGKEKNTYSLWKVHRVYIDVDEIEKGYRTTRDKTIIKFIWIGMWGSSVWNSIKDNKGKLVHYFDSLEEALKAAENANWKVCQVDYSNFDLVISSILSAHGIRKE
jgi:hypothetical protein